MLKAQLVMIAMAHIALERDVPPILVDRSHSSGLMLENIDSRHGTDHRVLLRRYMADSGLQKSTVPFNLSEFLAEVDDQFKAEIFSDGQDDIISSAPEMNDSAIHHLYAPLGGGKEKKSMRESLEKSCEQNGVIFHAVALLQHTTLLVTKQAASLRKDQTTRKETDDGEKPLPEEYLCIVELETERTTMESHGHELGIVTRPLRSRCPCPAGRGLCVHRGMALRSQLHQWGPGRPTDKPYTASLCGWVRGSKKRCYSAAETVSALIFEKHWA